MLFHFFRLRTIFLPTWKFVLLLLALVAVVAVIVTRSLYPFLGSSRVVDNADILIVDGWISDENMEDVRASVLNSAPDLILVTGVDLSVGSHLAEYKSYAFLGEATLEALGLPPDDVHPASAGRHPRNRTFASAAAVYQWLDANDRLASRLNIVTEGPHSRRSLMIYRKVFQGTDAVLGIESKRPPAYDPESWWETSSGVKSVIIESIALVDEWLRDSGRETNDPRGVATEIGTSVEIEEEDVAPNSFQEGSGPPSR